MEGQDFKDLLKRMGKREVVRLLETVEKENDSYRQQVRDLQQIAEQQEKQLTQAKLMQSMPGSLADSVAEANGVMLSAQKTANEYLAQIQELMDLKTQEAEGIVFAAKQEGEQIIARANQEKQRIEASCVGLLDALRHNVDEVLGKAAENYGNSLSEECTEVSVNTVSASEETQSEEEMNDLPKTKLEKMLRSLVTDPEPRPGAVAE